MCLPRSEGTFTPASSRLVDTKLHQARRRAFAFVGGRQPQCIALSASTPWCEFTLRHKFIGFTTRHRERINGTCPSSTMQTACNAERFNHARPIDDDVLSVTGCCCCRRLKLHRKLDARQTMDHLPGVSIVKPLMGVDPFLETNLESHFTLAYPKVYCNVWTIPDKR